MRVLVFSMARVMRKYTDCIDQLSSLSAATVHLNRELASASLHHENFDERCSTVGRDMGLFSCVLAQR